ncbi:carbamoyl-phosphate synthase small subunit [Natranaerovirga hydrolytica]|uniref:Carbamoyl phosphate synthase small chain n=1 Tax=Natranaerovirga hydrolytica TaxID=680378 RepID=A0A4R1N5Y0_9FIRM|nr:glutamine-hydrolyzing carbamoyl-phosphate synthase small subunit [Natranaerovirga hydrolytica]TCK98419.1 carbamoyl-phosphate synthase small subunit [Natranaerovirga hydrolytica]
MKINILLEDGTLLQGKSFGKEGTVYGEIVFNTGMTGYQEVLTDPSYSGQIVVMTYPLIGNYGINNEDFESDKIQVKAFVVKDYAKDPNHWQQVKTIDEYLKENNIMGVYDIDTRLLTKKIRNLGVMKCVMTPDEITEAHKEALEDYSFPKDIVKNVSRNDYEYIKGSGAKIGVIDLGMKNSILNIIKNYDADIHIFPWDIDTQTIEDKNLDMLFLSNGPGDPKELTKTIDTAKYFVGKMPIRGICLGHQVLALALGADTYKMKFGHRGGNHPVLHLPTNKVFITSQNHGYAVIESSVTQDMQITFKNVNDGTIEGIASKKYDIDSVQFHPEEGPGPYDAQIILDTWIKEVGGVSSCQ